MVTIINGPNGKFFLTTINILGISTILLCAYGIYRGCLPSISYGKAQLAFSKLNTAII